MFRRLRRIPITPPIALCVAFAVLVILVWNDQVVTPIPDRESFVKILSEATAAARPPVELAVKHGLEERAWARAARFYGSDPTVFNALCAAETAPVRTGGAARAH
jgi:hypothetical protein